MANLPQRQTLTQTQQQWASQLNPLLANPLAKSSVLLGIMLTNGVTVVDHKLGRKLQGWIICGINSPATIYDSQATNQTPELTLVLNSNAATTVSLLVF